MRVSCVVVWELHHRPLVVAVQTPISGGALCARSWSGCALGVCRSQPPLFVFVSVRLLMAATGRRVRHGAGAHSRASGCHE